MKITGISVGLAVILVLTAACSAGGPVPEPPCLVSTATPDGGLPANQKPCDCKGYVALTFDDGPTEMTDEYLHILRVYDAPATFFNVGKNERALPYQVARVEDAGHVVGNHTQTHPDMTTLTEEERAKELAEPILIHESLGHERYKFWRPPYGVTTPEIRREGEALGMTETLWDTDTKDYEATDPAQVVAKSRGMQDGDILLMHDGKPQTLAALPEIINEYYAQGLCWGVLGRTAEQRRSDVGIMYNVRAVKPNDRR